MITPTKGIAPQRALLTIAAQVSLTLTEPMTVSQAWTALKTWRAKNANNSALPFSWFVLALDVLYSLGALQMQNGLIHKAVKP
ncbi:ABC-three component system middle component 6 [Rhodococcus sp. 66b]|uniref:ABC-three component system middle component 6 n=1 Tax=Rhodococcus sp. 66b TaxID=1945511 RepID=UPI0009BA1BB6|nr:ABC-three component system middle component 6 [Rhodococcus sp. 66b]OQM78050.1 hypothetical protein B0E55_06095 [Rhodococcus sp. 66b]